jgi:hypothetical protein
MLYLQKEVQYHHRAGIRAIGSFAPSSRTARYGQYRRPHRLAERCTFDATERENMEREARGCYFAYYGRTLGVGHGYWRAGKVWTA